MKKIILDLCGKETRKDMHTYLQKELELPEYYGKNLDALYDCLTDVVDDLAVGLICPADGGENERYLKSIRKVFRDAEKENPHLCVFAWKV
ncbi:MAG: barstar family protein [Eubacteriales bacterium]|nr:barstar family protein [Eubacteriales bacterium]